jgi:hypothetical protein
LTAGAVKGWLKVKSQKLKVKTKEIRVREFWILDYSFHSPLLTTHF